MKWLVGGFLACLPVVNLLVGGYFLRYARQLRGGEGMALPRWDDWPALLLDTGRMCVLQLVFLVLPSGVGLGLTRFAQWIFNGLSLEFFAGTLAWSFLCVGVVVGLVLWMAAVQRFLLAQDWARVLDLTAVGRLALRMAPGLVFPVLALAGLLLLGWPLLGFSFFLGFGPFVAYSTAVYLDIRAGSVA